jgi:hypothetical protein
MQAQEALRTLPFSNARELADVLYDHQTTANVDAKVQRDQFRPIVYVMDRQGYQLSKAILNVETLTDGSKVYTITLL